MCYDPGSWALQDVCKISISSTITHWLGQWSLHASWIGMLIFDLMVHKVTLVSRWPLLLNLTALPDAGLGSLPDDRSWWLHAREHACALSVCVCHAGWHCLRSWWIHTDGEECKLWQYRPAGGITTGLSTFCRLHPVFLCSHSDSRPYVFVGYMFTWGLGFGLDFFLQLGTWKICHNSITVALTLFIILVQSNLITLDFKTRHIHICTPKYLPDTGNTTRIQIMNASGIRSGLIHI